MKIAEIKERREFTGVAIELSERDVNGLICQLQMLNNALKMYQKDEFYSRQLDDYGTVAEFLKMLEDGTPHRW